MYLLETITAITLFFIILVEDVAEAFVKFRKGCLYLLDG